MRLLVVEQTASGVVPRRRCDHTQIANCDLLIQSRLQDSVWAGSCNSWYKRPDGRITTLYPGTADEYSLDKAAVMVDHYHLTPTPSA